MRFIKSSIAVLSWTSLASRSQSDAASYQGDILDECIFVYIEKNKHYYYEQAYIELPTRRETNVASYLVVTIWQFSPIFVGNTNYTTEEENILELPSNIRPNDVRL